MIPENSVFSDKKIEKLKDCRPFTGMIEIDTTAEEIVRAIFPAAKPTNPSKRIPKSRRVTEQ